MNNLIESIQYLTGLIARVTRDMGGYVYMGKAQEIGTSGVEKIDISHFPPRSM